MQLTASNPQYAYAPTMMPMMAGGGLADAAQHLRSRGRGDDTMLVHMTPGEVKGLQALAMAHGGSLTVNPETGLPEAGFLKNLLPTIIGAGLTFFSGGTLNPATIGMITGGLEAVRTGDLGRGIMAGLGAYGGAGLGSALMSAGAAAPASIAANLGVEGASSAAGSQAAQLAAQNAGFGEAGLESLRSAAGTATGANMAPSLSNLQLAEAGVGNLGSMQGISNVGAGLDVAFPTLTSKAAAAFPTAVTLSEALTPKYDLAQAPVEKSNYAGPYYPTERSLRVRPEDDRSTSEFTFFTPSNPVPGYRPYFAAQGGLMDLARGGSFDDEPGKDEFAGGGLTALAGGRFLQGPGDGTSDSIPAVIGNKQPARLADGEFVIDARTVSEIGNGSSQAGAKKLYAMMDRVHKARKKAGRGSDSRAEKYLPA